MAKIDELEEPRSEELVAPAFRHRSAVALARRLWRLPLGLHAIVIGIVLLCVLPIVGTRSIVFSDEGAALVQAHQLERGDGWITPYAFTRIDPHQEAFPFASADPGHNGSAAYAKHPLYPLLLAGADRVGGNAAILALSIFGTVVAALFAGLLAGRWSPTIARPTVWMVGLASPLIFDSFLVVGHTLGAAAATIAVWCALRTWDHRKLGSGIAAIAALLVCAALRSEGVLFAMTLGGVVAYFAARGRDWKLLSFGGALGAAGVFVKVLEPRLVRSLLGTPNVALGQVSFGSEGRLVDAWRGFVRTWLSANYGAVSPRQIVVILIAAAVLGGVVVARTRPADSHAVLLFSGLAIGLAAALNFLVPGLVPGLVFAFPLLFAGLVVLRREMWHEFTPRFLVVVWLIFTAAVIATQYGVGGSVEWGGRYFSMGLPIACPIALEALRLLAKDLAPAPRRIAAIALVAVALTFSIAAVRAVRDLHAATDQLVATTERISAKTPAGDGGVPVILTDDQYLSKSAWAIADSRRFIWPPPDKMGAYLSGLRRVGITEVLFATRDPGAKLDHLSSSYAVTRVVPLDDHGSPWRFVVLRAR